MSQPLINSSTQNGVTRITLNRPGKRNALSRALIAELAEALDSAAADGALRAVVLAAEGPVFCAGMDLAEMQDRAGQPGAEGLWRDDTRVYRDLVVRLLTLPVPTLAVVQGPVLAGGVGLVLACDLVLAAEPAFFALPEPKRGITAAIVTPLLTYRIGAGPAGYFLLAGRNVSALDAHRFGLCHEVVPTEDLAPRQQEMIESILTGSPAALKITKEHLLECAAPTLTEQIDAAVEISATARTTGDAREGLAAFLEKRSPKWVPRSE